MKTSKSGRAIPSAQATAAYFLRSGIARRTRKRVCQGEANRKYFEHAGALMTADGTGDDLIKLEGVPKGEKLFTF